MCDRDADEGDDEQHSSFDVDEGLSSRAGSLKLSVLERHPLTSIHGSMCEKTDSGTRSVPALFKLDDCERH